MMKRKKASVLPGQNMTWKRFKRFIPFYLLGLPAMVYIFINNYMPLYGIQLAFKHYRAMDGISGSKWVGLENFKYLFRNDAWTLTRNTLLYNFFWMFLELVITVALAIFLNEIISAFCKKIYQSMILLPYLMSYVVVAYIAFVFLGDSGILNTILTKVGGHPVNWYFEPKYWPFILTVVRMWKSIGFGTIIYLSTLIGFGRDYYEAAELDGASKWQQIRFITIPLLKPTMIMMITLGMSAIFRSDFALFYQVPRNQGMLYNVTDTIDTYVFRAITQTGDMGLSSAAAFYQSLVCFATLLIFNSLVRKFNKENALF
jgi:putative aldouronate transport system permease protein